MKDNRDERRRDRWARLRFSIVGPLLASPPARGELQKELIRLSEKTWRHPVTGEPVRFGVSTIERWYYVAHRERRDPVGALQRQVRKDAGRQRSLSAKLCQTLHTQYQTHKSWTYQLHTDNLVAMAAEDDTLGPAPSYSTVRRYMKANGLFRLKRTRRRDTAGSRRAERRLERLEVRSYEVEYTNGLWHLDFHHGSRRVLTRRGEWATPILLGVLDDRSRLACHLQWYLDETAETLVHGLSQAIQKRGLPRALMTDNGGAMEAAEVRRGLHELGILHETTLPYSPYQNGKQEILWASVEGRLVAMLEGVEEPALALLNEATQAWVELEYNRKVHRELGCPPLERYLAGPDVGRDSPSSDQLRRAFRAEAGRTQRRGDGTISLEGRRFEVPSRYRHLERIHVRYARWDLRSIDLIDSRTGTILCPLYPLDKTGNADGRRRRLDPENTTEPDATVTGSGVAPLLRKLMADYAATGLPPAYLPRDEEETNE